MEYPQYYSTQAAPSASSTGIIADRFGFVATQIVLTNKNAVDFYVNFKSTGAATTADMIVRSSGTVQLSGLMIGGYAAYTTSTGATAQPLNISAFASA